MPAVTSSAVLRLSITCLQLETDMESGSSRLRHRLWHCEAASDQFPFTWTILSGVNAYFMIRADIH